MKIAFLDFEFGQIYGSWRRDFLITEVGLLIYDTQTDTIKLAEKTFTPVCDVIMRERVKHKNGTIGLSEYILNSKNKKKFNIDSTYKIAKKKKYQVRERWNKFYQNNLQKFLYFYTNSVDQIILFGGSEDRILLKKHDIDMNIPTIDLQSFLYRDYGKIYSLDLVTKLLDLNISHDRNITSKNHNYSFPNKGKKNFKYNDQHLKAHHAVGDCALLFLSYKELYDFNTTLN